MEPKLIGIDLGGTNVRAGLVADGRLADVHSTTIDAAAAIDGVLDEIFALVDRLDRDGVAGIGIGVPSVVDTEAGIVYDVQNIPSWTEVPLKAILEDRYAIPTHVNNDANCFALGEKHFGKGRGCDNMIGLIVGTGFAGGIIIGGRLYEGANCGAGEFGMMPFRDGVHEHYCSGQFFQNTYGRDGAELYAAAMDGDAEARRIFHEFGGHLGHAVKSVLFAYDPELIVFGGSVRKALPLFEDALWAVLETFAYQSSLERLRVEFSDDDHIALLGAAALCLDARRRAPQGNNATRTLHS